MCLQMKKVQGVLTGAVRSVSKRLALHCIATPVLPLQRVFPHTMRPKQDRKLHSGLRQGQATRLSARRPAQRPATEWGRHTAAPNALKTGHFKETFTECHNLPTRYDTKKMQWPLRQGQATRLSAHRPAQRAATRWGRDTSTPDALKTAHFKKTLTDFNILPTRYGPKILHWRLRQGQATRLSARRPAQHPATDWGRHTAAPNALKTGHSKQTFTEFNVLPTQYDTEKRIGASAKARRRAFRPIARPRRQGKRIHLLKFFLT